MMAQSPFHRGPARLAAALLAIALALVGRAALAVDLDALEQRGRADPQAALHALDGALPALAGTAQRLAALRLQGALLAALPDAERAEQVAGELDAQGTDEAAAAAAFVRARLLRNGGPLGRADRLLTQALARLPDDVPVAVRVRYLALHAEVKDGAGKLDDAVRLYQQALALAEPGAPAWRRSELRSSLAYTLYQAGQLDRAEALNREAREIAASDGDEVALGSAATTDAILATARGDAARELRALQGAIDHARRAGDRRGETLGLANLSDYYLKRGQYPTALQIAQQALPLARALKKSSAESLALTNSGLALVSMRRKAEGLASVRAGLAIEERAGSIGTMAMTYGELGQYLEQAGFLEDALDAYRQHRRLADEVFQRDQQQAILELQESFDNERRRRELALLNRENRIKEEELVGHELQQRLWAASAAGGVLLLAMLALLLRRVRERNAALASSNELLKRQSERDPLTGLANRRHFQAEMRQRAADGRLSGTLLLIDIDHFKRINDTYGHAAGDAVLVEVAQRLRATLREPDLVVRWGGEEFLVLVHALAPDEVEALAARLLAAIGAAPVDVAGKPIAATASIGFASFPLAPSGLVPGWEQAIALVDTAMYLAKAHGRNRAYGVRLLQARDTVELDALMRRLEAAWRDGEVALTLLTGPAPRGTPA